MPMHTQMVGGGIAPTHSQPGTRRGSVVSTMLQLLYPKKDLIRIAYETGWALGAGLDDA